MKLTIAKLAEYAKFVAALIGVFASSFAAFIPADYQPWFSASVAFLTAVAVLLVPNRIPAEPAEVPVADGDGPEHAL